MNKFILVAFVFGLVGQTPAQVGQCIKRTVEFNPVECKYHNPERIQQEYWKLEGGGEQAYKCVIECTLDFTYKLGDFGNIEGSCPAGTSMIPGEAYPTAADCPAKAYELNTKKIEIPLSFETDYETAKSQCMKTLEKQGFGMCRSFYDSITAPSVVSRKLYNVPSKPFPRCESPCVPFGTTKSDSEPKNR